MVMYQDIWIIRKTNTQWYCNWVDQNPVIWLSQQNLLNSGATMRLILIVVALQSVCSVVHLALV